MIEAVSKNGDKIHRDELHSALRVGIQKMENYEYPYNLLMSMFWGGGVQVLLICERIAARGKVQHTVT